MPASRATRFRLDTFFKADTTDNAEHLGSAGFDRKPPSSGQSDGGRCLVSSQRHLFDRWERSGACVAPFGGRKSPIIAVGARHLQAIAQFGGAPRRHAERLGDLVQRRVPHLSEQRLAIGLQPAHRRSARNLIRSDRKRDSVTIKKSCLMMLSCLKDNCWRFQMIIGTKFLTAKL